MSSAKQAGLKPLLAACAAAAGLAMTGAAQAQSVVVRSTGPSAAQYPQGKRLPVNARVTLRSGDRLTVLDKAGTRILAGPGDFVLNGAISRDQGAGSRVGSVLAAGGGARVRTGAVRGAPPASAVLSHGPDSIWYVDVTRGGPFCIANPSSVVLWRPNRDQPATAKLTAAAGGKTVVVMWKPGSSLRQWPAELPVANGAVFTFTDPVGPTVKITTLLLPTLPADQVEVAGMLADKGCTAQLDVLANAATGGASGG
jgi:hypothetical protein